MPQPSDVVYLNTKSIETVRAGLNTLLNGVLTHFVNGRISADVLFPQLHSLYQPSKFAPTIAAVTLNLRNRLKRALQEGRTTVRVNYNAIVLVQFALRVSTKGNPRVRTPGFESYLEAVRKRLKRAIISRNGVSEYRSIEARWTEHRHWLQLNVLLPLPPKRKVLARAYAQQQRQQLLAIARDVVSETCKTPVPEKTLVHAGKMATRHVRRGRYKIRTLRELLADQQKAREFIFRFLRDRELLDLRFEYKKVCEQMADRSEKFKLAMVVEPVFNHWDPVIDTTVSSQDSITNAESPVLPLRNEYDLRKEYCDWMLSEVEQSYWSAVQEESKYQLDYHWQHLISKNAPAPLPEIIAKYRLSFAECYDSNEMVGLWVDWSLHWLLAFTMNQNEIRSVIHDGQLMAKEEWQRMTAGEQFTRTQDIQKRCNFGEPKMDPFDVLVQSYFSARTSGLDGRCLKDISE